jgi:TPR repeat protein
MVKTLVERQMGFRAKRKAQGGMRLDMWLPAEEAAKLRKLIAWRAQTGPQVLVGLINEVWSLEVGKAAARGHAEAQFEYARMCAMGEGANRDRSKAKEWFSKSAEQGYRVCAAYNNLGVLWLEESVGEAVKWFLESAAQGNGVAQYNLGVLYERGHGVKRDYRQAVEWFLRSAERERGGSYAQQHLGVLYATGKGVTQDYDKAIEWLRRGTGKDSMDCENFLAYLLSTCHDDDIRDGHFATTISEKLVKLSASTDYLHTLAAAYAEAGRFEDAIKIQKKLISKLEQRSPSKHLDAALNDCQSRLNNYTDRKPWRDNSLKWLCFNR